jgi:hypothetical protein
VGLVPGAAIACNLRLRLDCLRVWGITECVGWDEIFDSMGTTDSEQVRIRDMGGHKVDPEAIRHSSICARAAPT